MSHPMGPKHRDVPRNVKADELARIQSELDQSMASVLTHMESLKSSIALLFQKLVDGAVIQGRFGQNLTKGKQRKCLRLAENTNRFVWASLQASTCWRPILEVQQTYAGAMATWIQRRTHSNCYVCIYSSLSRTRKAIVGEHSTWRIVKKNIKKPLQNSF